MIKFKPQHLSPSPITTLPTLGAPYGLSTPPLAEYSLQTQGTQIMPPPYGKNPWTDKPLPTIFAKPNQGVVYDTIQPKPKSAHEIINGFRHVVIDTSDVRGGKGDVAANYLLAMTIMQTWNYQGQLTIIGTPQSIAILSSLSGQSLKSGSHLFSDLARIHQVNKLPTELPPTDLYIGLARRSGTLNALVPGSIQPSSRRYRPVEVRLEKLPNRGLGVNLSAEATIVAMPVFENVECRDLNYPHGLILTGDTRAEIRKPGLTGRSAGIYHDPVAAQLRDKTESEVIRIAKLALMAMPDHPYSQKLSSIIDGELLQGADFSFAYVPTVQRAKSQVRSYLQGMIDHINKAGQDQKSMVLVTTSNLPGSTVSMLKSNLNRLVFIDNEQEIPQTAKPGTLYILQVGAIPHSLFNCFLALSEYPPVVSGDGGLSAALILGKPFVMAEISTNRQQIQVMNYHLGQLDPANTDLYGTRTNLTAALGAAYRLMNPETRAAFASLIDYYEDFAEVLIDSIGAAREYNKRKNKPTEGMASEIATIKDMALRISLLLDMACNGDHEALRHLAYEFRKDNALFRQAYSRGIIPEKLFKHKRMQRLLSLVLRD
jgi:hypothetical protein